MGAFFNMSNIVVKAPYSKPWIDYEAQIDKLRSRGLQIDDENFAKQFLSYSNYYRFTGYCLRFQYKDQHTQERVFSSNISFSQVTDLYNIDKQLRNCISDALELIEVSFRSAVAYHFAESYGPFGHTIKDNFDRKFVHRPTGEDGKLEKSGYDIWHADLIKETERSKELFVTHFKDRYSQYPDLPIWTALEICSFGTLSKMFKNMLRVDMRPIAERYKLQASTLDTWIHTFVYVRNICAHHSRLWDKKLSIKPQLPPGKIWDPVRNSSDKLYSIAMLLNWILAYDSFDKQEVSSWKKQFEEIMDTLFQKFPTLAGYTGFPLNWKSQKIWTLT